jgi:hypothetical protein
MNSNSKAATFKFSSNVASTTPAVSGARDFVPVHEKLISNYTKIYIKSIV